MCRHVGIGRVGIAILNSRCKGPEKGESKVMLAYEGPCCMKWRDFRRYCMTLASKAGIVGSHITKACQHTWRSFEVSRH